MWINHCQVLASLLSAILEWNDWGRLVPSQDPHAWIGLHILPHLFYLGIGLQKYPVPLTDLSGSDV